MQRTVGNALLVLACLALVGSTGCFGEHRTSNQGGGTLISAGTKIASGSIGSITPDEWQILCDNAQTLAAQYGAQFGFDPSTVQFPVLTDEQAQAVVDFLADNGITTITQLEAAIRAGTLQIPESLMGMFQSVVESQGT